MGLLIRQKVFFPNGKWMVFRCHIMVHVYETAVVLNIEGLFGGFSVVFLYRPNGKQVDNYNGRAKEQKFPLPPSHMNFVEKLIYMLQDDDSAIPDWKQLLNTHSPQRLMYSLQIVEGLSRGPKHRKRSMVSVQEKECQRKKTLS